MRLFTITLILMLIPTTILAVDNSGNFAIWGVGKKSCYGYGQSTADDDFVKYKHYMKGFLTAYNIFTEKTYNISGKMNENQIVEFEVLFGQRVLILLCLDIRLTSGLRYQPVH